MKVYPFKCLYPNLSLIDSKEEFFSSVKNEYSEFKKAGLYLSEDSNAFYLYKVKGGSGEFRGLLVANDMDDIQNRKIKPHEKTLPAKEHLMMKFALERQAMIKPLLLGYDTNFELEAVFDIIESMPSFFNFKIERETHTVWKILETEMISRIQKLFDMKIKEAYIADGHHRLSTALLIYNNPKIIQNIQKPIRTLSLYLPFSDLKIYDYNRIIQLQAGVSPAKLLAELSLKAIIEPLPDAQKPLQKFDFCVYIDRKWYRCRWKNSILANYQSEDPILDVAILNQELVKDILKLKDYELTYFVQFIPGTMSFTDFERSTHKTKNAFGVILHPVSIEELKSVADQEKVFPAKSTWFEPRVLNGVVSLELN